jgi:hypothetical protein
MATDVLVDARPGIGIAGRDLPALSAGLLSLRVHENVEGLFRCEATFGNWGARDGSTTFLYFGRDVLDFGAAMTISVPGSRSWRRIGTRISGRRGAPGRSAT